MFNFFTKVTPKLTEDLKKPFKLEGIQRIDETPVHKAVREAFVNQIIHADYLSDAGTLKVIKRSNEFEFINPGILKLPVEDIYRGGNSKSRNPRMQTMLRMVGFGDNAGSGFPAILATWKNAGWVEPILEEDTRLNQVTLTLKMIPVSQEIQRNSNVQVMQSAEKSAESAEKSAESAEKILEEDLSNRHKQILSLMNEDMEYSAEEIAKLIGLKGSRTRQLLKELAERGKISFTATTKKRKYKKI